MQYFYAKGLFAIFVLYKKDRIWKFIIILSYINIKELILKLL